ncbi:hypothetical protein BBK82_11150 [Lentzea guizhouensis]|uniref:Uncharacterized protein n=1 Tax=Lentzea guizhouensis TaxID=1586287 RepID=A0A1B2HFJ6_9PSEU|nr:hypothetical protein [Lentzea guizhouensis]ANZ36538.1 hypothetical protein BBK82_11150 [Lentzea guizhouensis]
MAGWAGTVVVNAVLGYVGVFPLAMALSALANTVGVWLGLAEHDLKFGNDGIGFAIGLTALLFFGFAAIFWTVNSWVSRLLKVRGPAFWGVALVVAVLPTVVAIAAPEVWLAVSWL